jgi:hypothetical protein
LPVLLFFQYYRKVNASYRNPFFPGIRKVKSTSASLGPLLAKLIKVGTTCEDQVIFALLDRWWKEEGVFKDNQSDPEVGLELRILDMAAGR